MTECKRSKLTFSSLSRKKIIADFNGGHLTSDGGGLLLRGANRRTGLTKALAACLTDSRQSSKITHDLKTMLAQRVFAIALGYEDVNGHQSLRDDPIMQLLAEVAPDPNDPLASPLDVVSLREWGQPPVAGENECRFRRSVLRRPAALRLPPAEQD